MADKTIDNAVDFLTKIRDEDEVNIRFEKKDGTMRNMRCTLSFKKIPKSEQPKEFSLTKILKLLNKNKILHVYDLDKQGWRSVPFNKTEYVETPKARFAIKKEV
jgi:hypothetical protein